MVGRRRRRRRRSDGRLSLVLRTAVCLLGGGGLRSVSILGSPLQGLCGSLGPFDPSISLWSGLFTGFIGGGVGLEGREEVYHQTGPPPPSVNINS